MNTIIMTVGMVATAAIMNSKSKEKVTRVDNDTFKFSKASAPPPALFSGNPKDWQP